MRLKLVNEQLLFEATWRNQANLQRHFEKQVLKDGETFNPDDPKFASSMTLDDYKEEAEKLSTAKADSSVYKVYTHDLDGKEFSEPRRSPNLASDVIGWELLPQPGREGRMPRKIKVAKYINPKFFPPEAKSTGRYRAAVFYVDEPSEDSIISFFFIRDDKFKNLFKYQWKDELPENRAEE